MIKDIYSKYREVSDGQWLSALINSTSNEPVNGLHFPLFPDPQTQIAFVGSANEHALKEVWPYYQHIRNICHENGIEFNESTRLLDVGSGWGRILRCFLKDIHPDNLYGVDTMPSSVALCKTLFNDAVNFSEIPPLPQTHFKDNWFDIIEGYSVVSHLSRHSGLLWLDEYYRILKPGGILALTVWQPDHYDQITNWQNTIKDDDPESYQKDMAKIYTQDCALEKRILHGIGFDFKSYSGDIEGNNETTYGEAIMSLDYIKEYWCRYFDFTAYMDTQELAQAIVVLTKPEGDHISITDDAVRQDQYKMMKQLDFVNGFTNVLAARYLFSHQKEDTPDAIKFDPSVIGYKRLVLNHTKAAIDALNTGFSRWMKSRRPFNR